MKKISLILAAALAVVAGSFAVAVQAHGDGTAPPVSVSNATYADQPTRYGPATVYAYWDADHLAQAADGSTPWAVFVHGGGWFRGHGVGNSDTAATCGDLVAQGLVCFGAEFTPSTQAVWPRQYHDVRNDVQWIIDHAAKFKLDPTRGVTLGRSSGALIAGVTAMKLGMKGFADLSGVIDLPHTMVQRTNPLLAQYAAKLVGGAAPTSALARTASVVNNPPTVPVRTLVQQCTHDPVIDSTSSGTMVAGLLAHQLEVELHEYQCRNHDLKSSDGGNPDESWRDLNSWIVHAVS